MPQISSFETSATLGETFGMWSYIGFVRLINLIEAQNLTLVIHFLHLDTASGQFWNWSSAFNIHFFGVKIKILTADSEHILQKRKWFFGFFFQKWTLQSIFWVVRLLSLYTYFEALLHAFRQILGKYPKLPMFHLSYMYP